MVRVRSCNGMTRRRSRDDMVRMCYYNDKTRIRSCNDMISDMLRNDMTKVSLETIWLGHAYGNDMTMKCLRNDIIMIRLVNEGYIYIYRYVVIWYEICYNTRYVINWHVYYMIWYIVMRNVIVWYVYDESCYVWKHGILWFDIFM